MLYHLYAAERLYLDNFRHFLAFGYDAEVDYYVIIAGERPPALPAAANITYVDTANHNHDYGGYSVALNGPVVHQRYDYFLFVNSSVRGPYLPHYIERPWHEILLSCLDDDVALAGATINILPPSSPYTAEFRSRHGGEPPFSHVQSMVFAMGRRRLEELLAHGVFSPQPRRLEKTHIITDYEILMSQLTLRAGFNIRCLLPEYNALDYRRPHRDINPTSVNGDPCFPGAYFGRTLHPFEALFVKTNRNIYPPQYLDALGRSMLSGRQRRRPLAAPTPERSVVGEASG